LIAALADHPGIGAVLVRGDDGTVEAVGDSLGDPLGRLGPGAKDALASLDDLGHLGDLILIGSVDAVTDEAIGFEELVGSHGGLGGAQMQPFLLCPAAWIPRSDPLVGAVAVYEQLREWLPPASSSADGA
jgi:hypothetical protein